MAISVAKPSAVVWIIASDCRASVILAGELRECLTL